MAAEAPLVGQAPEVQVVRQVGEALVAAEQVAVGKTATEFL